MDTMSPLEVMPAKMLEADSVRALGGHLQLMNTTCQQPLDKGPASHQLRGIPLRGFGQSPSVLDQKRVPELHLVAMVLDDERSKKVE